MGATDAALDRLLAQQAAYYAAAAHEYEDHRLPFGGGDELRAALDDFAPAGSVLELACGPGVWTGQLLRHAAHVTAVDASADMLALARARVGDDRVRYVQADLFTWGPDRTYDVVFCGFWVSHVPLERFVDFWGRVATWLSPGGRVFFVDDAYRTPEELVEGEESSTVERRLHDGSTFRAVKVPHRPDDLQARLAASGWDVAVTATADGPFYWGAGRPTRASGP